MTASHGARPAAATAPRRAAAPRSADDPAHRRREQHREPAHRAEMPDAGRAPGPGRRAMSRPRRGPRRRDVGQAEAQRRRGQLEQAMPRPHDHAPRIAARRARAPSLGERRVAGQHLERHGDARVGRHEATTASRRSSRARGRVAREVLLDELPDACSRKRRRRRVGIARRPRVEHHLRRLAPVEQLVAARRVLRAGAGG